MKILGFILLLLTLTACDTSRNHGNYFPTEYSPQLNIGDNSTLVVDSTVIRAGDMTPLTFYSLDIEGLPIAQGGARIEFLLSGEGSGSIDRFIDNRDGSYSAQFRAEKKGTVFITVKANNKLLKIYQSMEVLSGAPDLLKSNLFISKSNYLVGEQGSIVFQLKDSYGNEIVDPTLQIRPSLIAGTSGGIFSQFSYANGKYISTFQATQEGTSSQFKISLAEKGTVLSPYLITVAPTRPDYSLSKVIINSNSIKVGNIFSVSIEIYDLGSAGNQPNIPISVELSDESLGTVQNIYKLEKNYMVTILSKKAGTLNLRFKVDGEYLNSDSSILINP